MHNEPFGLSGPVIIKAAMSAYSPDGLSKCSPPLSPEIFLYVYYTTIHLFVLLLSKRSKTNTCKGRDARSLAAAAAALMEHGGRSRELDWNLLRLLLL